MKKMMCLLFCFILIFNSCETDFELNADWKDITIVYGLLNSRDTIHYIKVNKAFLGNADAYDMAQIKDSSEYKDIKVTIEQWENSQKVKEYLLKDTLITNKDTGIFYSPEQKVFYFTEPNLNANSEYELLIDINNGGKKVSATTPVINDFTISKPDNNPTASSLPISFANKDNFIDFSSKWAAAKNAKRYEISLIFHYTEVTNSGDSLPKTIEWKTKTIKSENISEGYEVDTKISGEEFFKKVAAAVPPIAENKTLLTRVVGNLDFVFNVAGEELNTYMEVNDPSTSIVQDKPEYTNIENGIGIFSCRYKKVILKRRLSTSTINELVTGDIGGYTGDRGFCDPSPTSPHSCK